MQKVLFRIVKDRVRHGDGRGSGAGPHGISGDCGEYRRGRYHHVRGAQCGGYGKNHGTSPENDCWGRLIQTAEEELLC